MIEVAVGSGGKAASIRLVKSSANEHLDSDALERARQWEYTEAEESLIEHRYTYKVTDR